MIKQNIVLEISLKTTALVRAGGTPVVVRVGRRQDEALRQVGLTGATLKAQASLGPDPAFGERSGEPVEFREVLLRIDRTADDDRLEVL